MLQVPKAQRLLLNTAASRALPPAPAVTMTPCDAPSPRANGCVIAHPTKDEVHPVCFLCTRALLRTNPPFIVIHIRLRTSAATSSPPCSSSSSEANATTVPPPPSPPLPLHPSPQTRPSAPGADTLLFNDLFRYSPDKARASVAAGSSSTPPAQAWTRVTSGIHPPPRSSCAAAVFRNHMCA